MLRFFGDRLDGRKNTLTKKICLERVKSLLERLEDTKCSNLVHIKYDKFVSFDNIPYPAIDDHVRVSSVIGVIERHIKDNAQITYKQYSGKDRRTYYFCLEQESENCPKKVEIDFTLPLSNPRVDKLSRLAAG